MLSAGTKWPSITSTWIVRAPAASTAPTCSPRRAKSAARIDGATPAGAPAIRSAGASSSGSGCRRRARCSTSARSSSARRSSGRPTRARSGAGSSRSGSGRAGSSARSHGSWQAGQTSPRSTARRRSRSALAAQAGDEEALGPVAVRERLGEAGHARMVPQRHVGRAGRRRGSPPRSARNACTTASFSAGEIVQVEYTSVPPGTQRVGARAQDRRLLARQPLGQVRRLAPARVGARGERAEVRARRVDEHAVVARRLVRRRRRRRCAPPRARPCARPCAAARPRARDGARRRRARPRPPSAPRGGSSCRRARRRGRARARPGRGASSRATVIAARDCGMKRRCSHSGEANASNGPSSTQALGQAGRRARSRRAGAPQARPGRRAAC